MNDIEKLAACSLCSKPVNVIADIDLTKNAILCDKCGKDLEKQGKIRVKNKGRYYLEVLKWIIKNKKLPPNII